MSAATTTRLRRVAEALAAVSTAERRAVLGEAQRLRREQCCAGPDLRQPDSGAAHRAAEIAKALSDPVRVELFDILRSHGGEVCQCDLQPMFELSQPTLSHHLRKLVTAGLVSVERRGRWAFYSTRPGGLEAIRSWLAGPSF